MIYVASEIATRYRPIYQMLFEETMYGYGENCASTKYFDFYSKWLKPKVVDLGCGIADTVLLMREEEISADGIDWVQIEGHGICADITKPLDLSEYETSLCSNVLQCLTDEDIDGLLDNMQQTSRQVFILNTGSFVVRLGHRRVNLFQNNKPFEQWLEIINARFKVVESQALAVHWPSIFLENGCDYLILAESR
jgi:hypothetical protein